MINKRPIAQGIIIINIELIVLLSAPFTSSEWGGLHTTWLCTSDERSPAPLQQMASSSSRYDACIPLSLLLVLSLACCHQAVADSQSSGLVSCLQHAADYLSSKCGGGGE
jgi:hypothetical protein